MKVSKSSYQRAVFVVLSWLVFFGYPIETASGSFKVPGVSIQACSTNIDPHLSSIDGVRPLSTDHPSSKPIFFKIDVDQFGPVGTQCASAAGIVFLRIRDSRNQTGWKDTGPGGRTWYDELAVPVNRGEARKFCAKKNQRLPSDEELRLASTHGFGEVLKNAKKIYAIWSSTAAFFGRGNGHVLNDLDEGTIISMSRSWATSDGGSGGAKLGAICVDR